ncbi:hypothetical protein C8R46DRAFT_1213319 [Mycena filopes]|nr:hypothetical protein C8R46DRAFT_1213319 [Mycena filopes]
MPSLPTELLREIIGYVLVTAEVSEELYLNSKKSQWPLICSLSVASKVCRALALEAWFQVLFSKSPTDTFFIEDVLPEIYTWTRKIHCILPSESSFEVWDLAGFLRLQALRLDCPYISHGLFINVPATLTELDIRGLRWPSPYVFQVVAALAPFVVTLRLSNRTTWCGLCNTCSPVNVASPVPAKLVYTGGLGLPIHYARFLSAMPHLRTVSITLPYRASGAHILLDEKDPMRDLWSGECDDCVGFMYGDAAFRKHWMARKRGEALPGPSSDSDSEFRLYSRPPALETVEWCFRPSDLGEEDTDEESEGDADEVEDNDVEDPDLEDAGPD